MKADKRAIRQELCARRRRVSQHVVATAGAAVCARLCALPAYGDAASLIAYLATDNEVPTGLVIAHAVAAGKRLLLPRITGGPLVVCWRPWEPLARVRPGLYEPVAGAESDPKAPALAVVPTVAWDETGTRLGRGGGYYDRLFAAIGYGTLRIGLAYEFQHVPGLPRDPWDVPLHIVITEQRIVWCRPPGVATRTAFQKGGVEL